MKFTVNMSRKETVLGWLLVLLHFLILPVGLVLINNYLPRSLTLAQINLIAFVSVFALTILIFWRFLWRNILTARQNLAKCLRSALIGFLIYWLGGVLISLLITQIDPDFTNINDANINTMLDGGAPGLAAAIVLMAPISEECMYRGLLLQYTRRLGKLPAYLLTLIIFALIHVVGYIGSADLTTLGLCLLQYLPAGFGLVWAYEHSDSIWTSITIHVAINLIGICAMR